MIPSSAEFANPWAFAGLILIPILVYFYFRRAQRQYSDFRYPSLTLVSKLP